MATVCTFLSQAKFDIYGNYAIEGNEKRIECEIKFVLVLKKNDLLSRHQLQPRDIRFSAQSLLYVRQSSIILRLQVN